MTESASVSLMRDNVRIRQDGQKHGCSELDVHILCTRHVTQLIYTEFTHIQCRLG